LESKSNQQKMNLGFVEHASFVSKVLIQMLKRRKRVRRKIKIRLRIKISIFVDER
jgi:hypothetical protein